MRATILLLLAFTGLPAPAHADPFAHDWCRLVTPRFTIITDLKAKNALKLAEQMEVFRLSAQPFIQGHGKTADLPLKVIVFRDRGDFRDTMKAPKFAGFMQPSLRESMLVIGPQQGNRLLHETALHEYSHYLLRNQINVSFPVWYDEGLATFLSTMRMTKRMVEIGIAPPDALRQILKSSPLTMKTVVESTQVYDWDQSRLNEFYLMVWALVHFIELSHQDGFIDRRPQLDAYLQQVMPPFEATFEVSYEELTGELLRYTRKRTLPTIRLPLPQVSVPPDSIECLSPQERNFELAVAMTERNPQQALDALKELHAADPQNPRYLIGLSGASYELNRYSEARGHAALALELAPEDAAAQIEFATRMVHGCILVRAAGCAEKWRGAVKLFRSGVRADPQRFDAVLGLGLSYLHSGRPGDALNYLKIAYQKAPWAPHINFYLGESYRLIGDRRAVVHLTNARNWSTQEVWQRLADAALAELR